MEEEIANMHAFEKEINDNMRRHNQYKINQYMDDFERVINNYEENRYDIKQMRQEVRRIYKKYLQEPIEFDKNGLQIEKEKFIQLINTKEPEYEVLSYIYDAYKTANKQKTRDKLLKMSNVITKQIENVYLYEWAIRNNIEMMHSIYGYDFDEDTIRMINNDETGEVYEKLVKRHLKMPD